MAGLPVRARRVAVGLASVGTAFFAAPSLAQSQFAIDASASAGISSNPNLGVSNSRSTVTANLDVRPSLVIERELTNILISADAQVSFYGKDYPTTESFSLRSAVEHRLSGATSMTAEFGYTNTITGSFNDIRVSGAPFVPDLNTLPESNLPVYLNDPSLGGIGRRRQSYQAATSITTALTSRDRLGVSVSGAANRTDGGIFSNFNTITPGITYSRAIAPRFDVGVSMTASFTNYLGTRVGDAVIYQPSLTLSRVLSERWTLNASAGAAISRLNEATGGTSTATGFNGSTSLCRRDLRWNGCLNASYSTAPSVLQGVRRSASLGASFGYRVSAKDSVSLNASYSRTGAPLQQTVVGPRSGSLSYVTASGSYNHVFGRALSGFVSGGVSTTDNDVVRRGANLNALIGINYRFGGRRR